MNYAYTTGDGVQYAAGDGTPLMVGSPSTVIDSLITDRTLSDVEAVRALTTAIKAGTATEEQVSLYVNALQKGAYTYRDLNRVEEAVQYVAERLKEVGYDPSIEPVKTWTVEDTPNKKEFDRYFRNDAHIRATLAVWASTPEAPDSIAGFDVNKANALEQILVDVNQVLNKMQAAWFYFGDLYAGEV